MVDSLISIIFSCKKISQTCFWRHRKTRLTFLHQNWSWNKLPKLGPPLCKVSAIVLVALSEDYLTLVGYTVSAVVSIVWWIKTATRVLRTAVRNNPMFCHVQGRRSSRRAAKNDFWHPSAPICSKIWLQFLHYMISWFVRTKLRSHCSSDTCPPGSMERRWSYACWKRNLLILNTPMSNGCNKDVMRVGIKTSQICRSVATVLTSSVTWDLAISRRRTTWELTRWGWSWSTNKLMIRTTFSHEFSPIASRQNLQFDRSSATISYNRCGKRGRTPRKIWGRQPWTSGIEEKMATWVTITLRSKLNIFRKTSCWSASWPKPLEVIVAPRCLW